MINRRYDLIVNALKKEVVFTVQIVIINFKLIIIIVSIVRIVTQNLLS